MISLRVKIIQTRAICLIADLILFSEPETRALRDLMNQGNPKSGIIFHSRHISHESRILVPFIFHKSSFMQNNIILQMLSDADIAVYKNITSEMQAALPLMEREYTVGTSWETIQHTISGSDLDWIYENTRAYSIILQLGTDEGSYWPSPDLISGLIEKHTNPVLKFLSLSHTLPEKTTAKTVGSSLLKHFSRLPFI
ncbi:hypothetical protein BC830DRAFT_695531 [Chytriomyces sp. MP71]|nr:hypothetical protein BC830DRAFT_695531 [Chytriomyces sp. MP71]